jgi:hypothetical protein
VFSLVATRLGPGAVGAACVLAFVVAVGLIARSLRHGGSAKLLEVTGAVVFLVLGIVAVAARGVDGALAEYGRAIAAAVLAAVILVDAAGHAVHRAVRAGERAARVLAHRAVSVDQPADQRRVGWRRRGDGRQPRSGGHFEVPDPRVRLLHRPVGLVFNWVVPGLLVWAAARYTQRLSGAPDDAPTAPAGADRGADVGRTR